MTHGFRMQMAASNNGAIYFDSVYQVDAGNASSYPGSGQIWANLTATPADGSAQTAYDFWLGANGSPGADDPTFNGVAGNESVNEYFSFDGGDLFTLKNGNTTFLNSLHKAGAQFTIIYFIKTPTIPNTTVQPLFATYPGSGNGVRFSISGNASNIGSLQFQCSSGGAAALNLAGSSNISSNTNYMLAVSLNEGSGSSGTLLYVNQAFQQLSANYSSPSSSNATSTLTLGNFNTTKLPSGYRFYQVIVYNRALTKFQLDTTYNTYKTRYSLP